MRLNTVNTVLATDKTIILIVCKRFYEVSLWVKLAVAVNVQECHRKKSKIKLVQTST